MDDSGESDPSTDELLAAIEDLEARLERVEDAVGVGQPPATGEGTPRETADAQTPQAEPVRPMPDEGPQPPAEPPAADAEPAPGGATTDDSRGIGGSEFTLGVKVVGVVGAIALVFATVYAVRLAAERGLLGPAARVVLGTVVGLGLLAGGRYAARERGLPRWGRVVAGGGFVVAYYSLYAMTAFASYRAAIGLSEWASVVAMTALAGGTVAVALRDDDPLFASGAVLAGYLTVLLLLADRTSLVTPAYLLGLTVAVTAVVTIEQWRPAVPIGAALSYISFLVWWDAATGSAPLLLGYVLATVGVFAVGTETLRRSAREGRLEEALTADRLTFLVGILALFAVTIGASHEETVTAGALLIAAYAGGVHLLASERWPAPTGPAEAFLGYFALLVGLMVYDVRIGLAGTTLAVLGGGLASRRLRADGLRRAGYVAFAVVVVAAFGEYGVTVGPFEGLEPLEIGVLAFMAAAGYGLYALDRGTTTFDVSELRLPQVYAWAGWLLVIRVCAELVSGLALSAAWALFGFAVVAIGVREDAQALRYNGFAALGVASLKVFFVDTSNLDPLARVVSFIVLGVVLLVTSYLYARTQPDVDLPGLEE